MLCQTIQLLWLYCFVLHCKNQGVLDGTKRNKEGERRILLQNVFINFCFVCSLQRTPKHMPFRRISERGDSLIMHNYVEKLQPLRHLVFIRPIQCWLWLMSIPSVSISIMSILGISILSRKSYIFHTKNVTPKNASLVILLWCFFQTG